MLTNAHRSPMLTTPLCSASQGVSGGSDPFDLPVVQLNPPGRASTPVMVIGLMGCVGARRDDAHEVTAGRAARREDIAHINSTRRTPGPALTCALSAANQLALTTSIPHCRSIMRNQGRSLDRNSFRPKV